MSLEPLLNASPLIQAHAFAAMAAFVLGVIQVTAPKGTLPHKSIGVLWLTLMITVTATSAFIGRPTEPGDPFWARFSFIHGFTILSIFALYMGISLLMSGPRSMKYHSQPFTGLFIGGLVVAGALAFLPGRIMHAVAFGG